MNFKTGFLFLFIILFASVSFARDVSSIYPYPKAAWNKPGQFTINAATTIMISQDINLYDDSFIADALQAAIKKVTGYTLQIGGNFTSSGNVIQIGEIYTNIPLQNGVKYVSPLGEPTPAANGYVIDISPTGILLAGSDQQGTMNALTSFIQLFNVSGQTISVSNAHVWDYPDYPDRWVFSGHNLLVGSQLSALEAIADTMSLYKLNGIQQNDFKYSILQIMGSNYFQNVDSLKSNLQKKNIQLIPGVIGLGWSSGILYNDPNLAEGLPAQSTYYIEGDTGKLVPDPRVKIAGGDFENLDVNNQFTGWSFYDGPNVSTFQDKTIFHSGSASAKCTNFAQGNPSGNCRFSTLVNCDSNKYYSMSAWVKTQSLKGGYIQMLALGGASGQTLTSTELSIASTMDWTRVEVNFNTLGNTSVRLYIGVWGGQTGTIWFDDFAIKEAGLSSVLRRAGCPITVQNKKNGQVYTEGVDYIKLIDPWVDAHKDSYFPYHTPPTFRLTATSAITNGDSIIIRYYHPYAAISDNSGNGSVMACVSEDTLYKILSDQVRRVNDLYHPEKFFMGHDEIRNMNHDKICTDRHLSPASLLANNVTKCHDMIFQLSPFAEIFMWSDMVDSLHNAHNNYYLVNGDLSGDWDNIPKDITIVNWNGSNARSSLEFFERHGFKQISSPYYDAGNTSTIRSWRIAQEGVSNVKGMMYTTWANDYNFLRAFGYYAWGAGPNIIHNPLDTSVLHSLSFIVNATVIADPFDNTDKIVSVSMNIVDSAGSILNSYSLINKVGNLYSASIPNVYSNGFRYNITAINSQGITRTLPNYIIIPRARSVPKPEAPLLISPPNGFATSDSVHFLWHSSVNTKSYILTIASDSLFSNILFKSNGISDTVLVLPPLNTLGINYWKVQAIGDGGNSSFSEIWSFQIHFPDITKFLQSEYFSLSNHPNPFNSESTINFVIPHSGFISLKLYDMLGKKIRTITSKYFEAGSHSILFDANDIPAGNYIYELKTSDDILSKHLQIVR
jgi:hypothetical protein